MADYSSVTNASNAILEAIRGATDSQKTGQSKIKEDYGYDSRVQNLDKLRRTSYDTEKLLQDLPQNVNNRMRGRLVTAGQRARVLQNEQNPLATQLANVARGTQAEQEGINTIRGLLTDFSTDADRDFQRQYSGLNLQRQDAQTLYNQQVTAEEAERQRQFQAEMEKQRQAIAWAQFNEQKKAQERQEALQQAILNSRLNPGGAAGSTLGMSTSANKLVVGDQAEDTSLGGRVSTLAKGLIGIPASAGANLNRTIWSANPQLNQQREQTIMSSPFLNDLSMRFGDLANWVSGAKDFRGYQ